MSYSLNLKKDLLSRHPENRKVARAELAGILSSGARPFFTDKGIGFGIHSENARLIRYLYTLINEFYGIKGKVEIEPSKRFKKHHTYSLTYERAEEVLEDTGTLRKNARGVVYYSPVLSSILSGSEEEGRAFLKGMFLWCGSIVDPERSYHLEINASNDALIETCAYLLENFGIEAHVTVKKTHSVLYLKDSQAISDFLGLIGANEALFNFEEIKVIRQMREETNRRVNCETANMDKAVEAASAQITAIKSIMDSGRFEELDEPLKKAAQLRLKHPRDSIGRLSERMKPPVSRSTLHRRLKRIVEIAKENPDDRRREEGHK